MIRLKCDAVRAEFCGLTYEIRKSQKTWLLRKSINIWNIKKLRSHSITKTFVVKLNIGNFGDNILEKGFLPAGSRVRHHCLDGIVIFLILVVEEDKLGPKVSLFCCSKDLWRQKLRSGQYLYTFEMYTV